MKRFSLLMVAIFSFVLISCDKSPNNPDDDGYVIYRLENGSSWEYLTQYEGASLVETHSNKVIKDTVINNEKWTVLAYDDSVFWYVKNKADGLYFNTKNKTTGTWSSALYYKYKANVGETYTNTDNVKIDVVSINDTITVPDGIFVCYKYRVKYSESLSTLEYYSPNIGLIKLIAFKGDGTVEYTTTLKEHTFLTTE
ncbi:MAG: hypothetical protein WCR42_06720 [bacterium]